MSAAAQSASSDNEFPFTDEDFAYIQKLVREITGIVLGDHKRAMVYGRLARRLRALNLRSVAEYRAMLEADGGKSEIVGLTNAITTNLTKFFRESHHFDHLRDVALPDWLKNATGAGKKRLRMWSAGCSTGEEPYSIAMTTAGALGNLNAYDVKLLATDLDTNVLDRSRRGIYPRDAVELIPTNLRTKYCSSVDDDGKPAISMSDDIRRIISFKQLNLMGAWPMKGPFDVIFCRNVLIYFDGPTKRTLIDRYTQMLRPGGWLYIGHSESLTGTLNGLVAAGRTTYQRTG